jgi:prepilin-type N-terminal cleavage/methylation domain-containing protein
VEERACLQRNAHGFTLIELLLALVIVAILASLAFSSYASYVLKAHNAAAIADILSIERCIERYYTIYRHKLRFSCHFYEKICVTIQVSTGL